MPHTPLPWKFEPGPDSRVVGSNGETVCDDTSYYPTAVMPDDQAFIVRALDTLAEIADLPDVRSDEAAGMARRVLEK